MVATDIKMGPNNKSLGVMTNNDMKNLTFRGTCIGIYSYNKTNEMHYFTNLFRYRALHVSDRFTVHHQESSTVYTVFVIQVMLTVC